MPLPPGTRLGRYVIISPLGAGGMGEVYRAEDTLLGRQVAVKVLPEHLAENPDALKRFQKEAKALTALSHSNILAIQPNRSQGLHGLLGEDAKAERYFDLAISLGPDQCFGTYQEKAGSHLRWTGDTKGARAIIMKIPKENSRNEYLHWLEMLDRNYQAALDLLPLPTKKGYVNAILAGDCYRLMNKPAQARASYDTARIELEKLLQNSPEDFDLHNWISFANAGLNRNGVAIREAETAVELYPVSKDAQRGPSMVRDLAAIYVMVGEYEPALDKIEYLLSIPSWLSVPMLRIDPTWDPLRSHPRFQKILEKYGRPQAP